MPNTSNSQPPTPILAAQSAQQTQLASGAEVNVVVTLPTGFLTPAVAGAGGKSFAIATVTVNTLEANVNYVATMQNQAPGSTTFTIKVRNVGSVGGTTGWVVNVLWFGPGDALGI